jgi:hypothetical protein
LNIVYCLLFSQYCKTTMGIGKIETRDKGWGDGLMAGGEAIAAGEKIAPDPRWEKMVEKKVSLRQNTAK